MDRRFSGRVAVSVLALALGAVLTAPVAGYAETQGGERRDDRRDGRDAGRDAKDDCNDAGGNRIDCRQEKRDVKHGGGEAAPEVQKEDVAPE